MDYSDKIKAIQQSASVEADGIATSKTWIAIYHLLFASVPYDLNIGSIIKEVQQKIGVRIDGHATFKTWDSLYQCIVESKLGQGNSFIDLHNEIILQSMTREVVPFAKELIRLAGSKGINIRLMCGATNDVANFRPIKKGNKQIDACNHDFGLVFDVGIYENTPTGEFVYQNSSSLYAVVAQLGESIGLTWAGDKKTFTSKQVFELRPAWALRMKEMEMFQELCRRRKENINLLAIL